jgi:hypothetical protein
MRKVVVIIFCEYYSSLIQHYQYCHIFLNNKNEIIAHQKVIDKEPLALFYPNR